MRSLLGTPVFTKRFDRRVYLAIGVFAFSVALGVSFGAYSLWPSNAEAGYGPMQPFAFDHKVHAGTLKIDCLYCHSNADKGAHATVPPLSTCMNCHTKVQPKDDAGQLKPAISDLLRHWENKEPIEWIKVNDVADFVYFDHSRHASAEVPCQQCHGPVEAMTQMRRQHGLKMAFCLDCHTQDPEPSPASASVLTVHSASEVQPSSGTLAPTHCTTCHR